MTNPLPYLVRMLLFLAAVAGLAFYLREDLIRVFNNTPDLDAVILFVLLLGIFFIFRQVIILWPEVRWLRQFQHAYSNGFGVAIQLFVADGPFIALTIRKKGPGSFADIICGP